MSNLVHVGDVCPNVNWTDDRKRHTDYRQNILRFGHTQAGRQRYGCQTGQPTLTETNGTRFDGRRIPIEQILPVLADLAEGNRISRLTGTTGHPEDTLWEGLTEAAEHVEALEAV